jgi:hypothetical protein
MADAGSDVSRVQIAQVLQALVQQQVALLQAHADGVRLRECSSSRCSAAAMRRSSRNSTSPARRVAAAEGQHDQAAMRFCSFFTARRFQLEYASVGRNKLLVELTSAIQHEGYGDNEEELGDLWSLKPVFLLSWTSSSVASSFGLRSSRWRFSTRVSLYIWRAGSRLATILSIRWRGLRGSQRRIYSYEIRVSPGWRVALFER